MGQAEVYQLLKKSDDWLSARDIQRILDLNIGSVRNSLKKLTEYYNSNVLVKDVRVKSLCQFYYNILEVEE